MLGRQNVWARVVDDLVPHKGRNYLALMEGQGLLGYTHKSKPWLI